eukprot:GHVL01019022.1.p2 GENE.GHVL01019022.1~~GHVL01019022.1.p2  ORF type:complete len:166 (-),score=29.85 GHVL01019022.1:1726-2223(-)
MKMRSWFYVTDLPVLPTSKEFPDDLKKAIKLAHSFIEEEEKNTPSDKIVIGGFSQGGALALLAGLSYPKKLAGIVSFSGWLMLRQEFPQFVSDANKMTPILIAHGTIDSKVDYSNMKVAIDTLPKSIPVTAKHYQGMDHSSSNQELDDLKVFLQSCLNISVKREL